jgi:hypothetical protein
MRVAMSAGRPGPGRTGSSAGLHQAATDTGGLLGDGTAAAGMDVEHGWAVGGRPPVAQVGQRDDGQSQVPVPALVGQLIFEVVRVPGVAPAFHGPGNA